MCPQHVAMEDFDDIGSVSLFRERESCDCMLPVVCNLFGSLALLVRVVRPRERCVSCDNGTLS